MTNMMTVADVVEQLSIKVGIACVMKKMKQLGGRTGGWKDSLSFQAGWKDRGEEGQDVPTVHTAFRPS